MHDGPKRPRGRMVQIGNYLVELDPELEYRDVAVAGSLVAMDELRERSEAKAHGISVELLRQLKAVGLQPEPLPRWVTDPGLVVRRFRPPGRDIEVIFVRDPEHQNQLRSSCVQGRPSQFVVRSDYDWTHLPEDLARLEERLRHERERHPGHADPDRPLLLSDCVRPEPPPA
jgi:hypothetical protein